MLGDRSDFWPSCLNEKSNGSRQHGQVGVASICARSHSVVRCSRSNGSPSLVALPIMPCRITLARAITGARSKSARRLAACMGAFLSAYSCRRRGETLSLFARFQSRMYALLHSRQVPVMPPRHALLRAKNSGVAGHSRWQFEQIFISQTCTDLPVWGNETAKFGAAA